MKCSKIRIGFVCLILVTMLVFILFGIHTKTITYYASDDSSKSYQKTYFSLSNCLDVELEEPTFPMTNDDNIIFNGWYYDSALQRKAEFPLQLTDNLELYAGWTKDNPNTNFLLPEIHITSETNFENIDRWEYNTCSITLTNTLSNHCIDQSGAQIRGRGNSTWNEFDKKSYKIKFDDSQNLFDFGSDKDWVLLSNSVDYTLMRNEIAMNLGHIFELDYTSHCQWVQLFYNESYQGIYLLCESIETGINRVNIESPYEPDEIFVGYLLELGGELDGFTLPPVESATTNWADYFSCDVIYPQDDVITAHQYEYIDAYMQLVNNAILTQNWNELTELVDIQSFADWYLVNEIMLNGDMGWSMFAYMPAGEKLYLGPIWDFDQSCGVSVTGGVNYETWYPDTGSQNTWFNCLLEMDEFKQLLKERWNEKLPEVQEFLVTQQEKSFIYSHDIAANFERWPVLGTTSWRIREEIGDLSTYEENIDFLFDWLNNRIHWLNQELSDY